VSGTEGISRKLHEQSAAREMERHYSKDQILEAYLNQINLGRGWYGVEAASRTTSVIPRRNSRSPKRRHSPDSEIAAVLRSDRPSRSRADRRN
jgi:membrane carboxypeptidase/penicillin-binding protein PbpC